ncbi:MAG: hypothetical protein EI684_05130 [Candidatus Viridilinea halotolerans]|uniref:Uncharacterized protein n=1 Tax=Candidatus Viridilinea halotolerans TaxID=2491704 RepID=A0A426U5P3_9CHLR|nr:MAG: hypothetical protein EI684_05130 [Candidatus Viridilinea halotolerans]
MTIHLHLKTRAGRAATHAAIERVLATLASATAARAEAEAPHATGFLASTVTAIAPNTPEHPAETVQTVAGARHVGAGPAAGPREAFVHVAASYALFVELRDPFLLPALYESVAALATLLADEGL